MNTFKIPPELSNAEMTKFQIWLNASRPRTLPLSLSGIITGSALAWRMNIFDKAIFIPAILTTLFLQILSNLANDYGDAMKGTDDESRVGPQRMVQSGLLSHKEIKGGIIILGLLAFISGFTLLINAFGWAQLKYFILFLFLGLLSIWAALQYTIGKKAYGYRGLGDLFVMIFFGLLAVSGCYFLYAKSISWPSLLQSLVIGCLATGVLHINNMRDRIQDQKSGKNTIAVKLGEKWSKIYFLLLIGTAVITSLFSIVKTGLHLSEYLVTIVFIPWILIVIRVFKIQGESSYNNLLKPLALSAFIYSLLLFISYII